MKKVTALFLAVLMIGCMALVTGCGGPSADGDRSIAGTTWILSGGSQGDMEVTQEQLEALLGEMSYRFEDGGKVIASVAGQTAEGTWTQDGNTVTISSNGQNAALTRDGDKMTMEQSGTTVYFTKK